MFQQGTLSPVDLKRIALQHLQIIEITAITQINVWHSRCIDKPARETGNCKNRGAAKFYRDGWNSIERKVTTRLRESLRGVLAAACDREMGSCPQ